LLQFKRRHKNPINQLSDLFGYPASCAVDSSTGDLAVTNLADASGGAGGVLVYRHAHGTPSVYENPDQLYYYFAGYDSKGDLYASGMTAGNAYILSVLPKNKTKMSSIAIHGGRLYFPGTVLWNGSSLVLGDQKCKNTDSSCLYLASISGTTATITTTIPLTGSCDVAQMVVNRARMFGGDYASCKSAKSSIERWVFPAGGKPLQRVTDVQDPIGAAISR
jgi:hypothetical protein